MTTLSETVHEGMDALLRMKDAQRALVATISNGGQLVVQSIHSLQASELDANSPVTTVLAQVHKQAKALLVLDAEQEIALAGVPENRRQELRSAVCVPVIGERDNKLLGILYADSKARVGNFTYSDLNSLQASAHQMAPRLAEFLALPASARKRVEAPTVTKNQLLVVGGLLLASLLWFVVGAAFSTRKEPQPQPVVGLAQSGPPVVVASFLGMLANSDWEHIPRTLSQGMNRRWPAERLAAELPKWMADGNNRADLMYRRPRPGSGVAMGGEATVLVDTQEQLEVLEPRWDSRTGGMTRSAGSRERQNYWIFKMKKEGPSWKIDSIEEAPASFQRASRGYMTGANSSTPVRTLPPLRKSAPSPSGG